MNGREEGKKIHTISFYTDMKVAPPATPGLPHCFSSQCSEGVNEWSFLRYLNNIPDCRGRTSQDPPCSPGASPAARARQFDWQRVEGRGLRSLAVVLSKTAQDFSKTKDLHVSNVSTAPPLSTTFLTKMIKLCQSKPLSNYSFHSNQQYHINASSSWNSNWNWESGMVL